MTIRKHLLLSAIALTLATGNVFAAPGQDAPPPPMGEHEDGRPPQSLAEARKKAHERAEKLDKMTEQEFAEHEKKHREWMEKWHNMTPEQQEEIKKRQAERRQERQAGTANSQPAGNAPAPAATR